MPEGKKVNLRILEREDLPHHAQWFNNPKVFGEFNLLNQPSREDIEKGPSKPHELKMFIVDRRGESKIGFIGHFCVLHLSGRRYWIDSCIYSILKDKWVTLKILTK